MEEQKEPPTAQSEPLPTGPPFNAPNDARTGTNWRKQRSRGHYEKNITEQRKPLDFVMHSFNQYVVKSKDQAMARACSTKEERPSDQEVAWWPAML